MMTALAFLFSKDISWGWIVFIVLCIFITIVLAARNNYERVSLEEKRAVEQKESEKLRLRNLEKQNQADIEKLQIEKQYEIDKLKVSEELLEKQNTFYQQLLVDKAKSFPYIAGMISNWLTLNYQASANYLKVKTHPAPVESLRIKELRRETKEYVKLLKTYEYKYAYLLALYPELSQLFDEDFIENYSESTVSESEDSVDHAQAFLSEEEWASLSITDRNQLALDRYISSNKSKWHIGRDFEMYVGYSFTKEGYIVEYSGIHDNLKDLGRDLICKKGNQIYIVQCKYWSSEKTIHEKHIFQLFGSTISYIIENDLEKDKDRVKALFITSTGLSDVAKKFAKMLDVEIKENEKLKEFPRIKCNINRTTNGKIYHLPFDQQYDATQIIDEGEMYVFTVAEAENKGFRRAYRWHSTDGGE